MDQAKKILATITEGTKLNSYTIYNIYLFCFAVIMALLLQLLKLKLLSFLTLAVSADQSEIE
jgi:hypothetical protein